MSNVQPKIVFRGDWAVAIKEPDGSMPSRPIYLKYWLNGSYVSVDAARKLVEELNAALAALNIRT